MQRLSISLHQLIEGLESSLSLVASHRNATELNIVSIWNGLSQSFHCPTKKSVVVPFLFLQIGFTTLFIRNSSSTYIRNQTQNFHLVSEEESILKPSSSHGSNDQRMEYFSRWLNPIKHHIIIHISQKIMPITITTPKPPNKPLKNIKREKKKKKKRVNKIYQISSLNNEIRERPPLTN